MRNTPTSFIWLASAVLVLHSCQPTATDNTSPRIESNSKNISVSGLSANDQISSPLTIKGEARRWYFEASFPVRLHDGNGTVIAQGPAQAQGEWMTTDFVPFEAVLTFTKPATPTGYVVLEEDDPSGEKPTLEFMKIPIRF